MSREGVSQLNALVYKHNSKAMIIREGLLEFGSRPHDRVCKCRLYSAIRSPDWHRQLNVAASSSDNCVA